VNKATPSSLMSAAANKKNLWTTIWQGKPLPASLTSEEERGSTPLSSLQTFSSSSLPRFFSTPSRTSFVSRYSI
jgi:hypothetical protein